MLNNYYKKTLVSTSWFVFDEMVHNTKLRKTFKNLFTAYKF